MLMPMIKKPDKKKDNEFKKKKWWEWLIDALTEVVKFK